MKKLITILLLSLYTFGATDAYQLLKIPLLIEHFIQHKQQDNQINFLSFLQMHYAEKQEKDADYQQDMQLPFKTNDANVCMNVTASFPSPIYVVETISFPIHPSIYNLSYDYFYININPSKIFQPPKSLV
ncbi:MAG: hypothetical protein ACOVNY_06590 [Chitinophagaceae bacterium]